MCLVYDPEHRISNASGFQSDLSREDDDLAVEVLAVPQPH